VVVEVLDGRLFGLKGADVLSLEFLDHLEAVACVPFEYGQNRAVASWSVRSDEVYIVC